MTKRILAIVAATGLCLGLPGMAGAAELVEGQAQVRGKNSIARTLTIGGTDYSVTPETVLLDSAGGRLSFEQVPVARRHLGGWVLSGETMVDFEARVTRSGAELRRMKALGQLPR